MIEGVPTINRRAHNKQSHLVAQWIALENVHLGLTLMDGGMCMFVQTHNCLSLFYFIGASWHPAFL